MDCKAIWSCSPGVTMWTDSLLFYGGIVLELATLVILGVVIKKFYAELRASNFEYKGAINLQIVEKYTIDGLYFFGVRYEGKVLEKCVTRELYDKMEVGDWLSHMHLYESKFKKSDFRLTSVPLGDGHMTLKEMSPYLVGIVLLLGVVAMLAVVIVKFMVRVLI